MRRIDLLITQSRKDTDNLEYSDQTGIGDDQYLQYFNDAQEQLQARLLGVHASIFRTQSKLMATVLQEQYSWPSNIYQQGSISMLEYSADGTERNYNKLDKSYLNERASGVYGIPTKYIPFGNGFLTVLTPNQTGTFRFTYNKRLPKLDKRRAQVSAVVLDTVNYQVTSLTLDPTTTNADDLAAIANNGYMTLADLNGVQKMCNIPVSAIDSTSGVVTLGAFTYDGANGETASVGLYALVGGDSTTHCQLPDNCERYLIVYANWKAFRKPSSKDSLETKGELDGIEQLLKESYAENDQDVDGIDVLDTQFLDSY